MVTKNQRAAQLQVFQLAGAGVSQGDSTMTLVSFNSIAGIALTMAAFGTSGYITVEPGSGQYEEQIQFTGITNNMDGTVTLTGISNVSMLVDPSTEEPVLTANFQQDHAGGVNCCVSNTSGWYATFANINNTMTIHEPWTFNANSEGANPKIDSNSYAFQPLDYITTGGVSSLIVNGTFNYWQDTGSVNTIVITPSPAVTAYAAGQFFFINVADTNTGATTINVNGLGAIDLKKEVSVALNPGDILAGEIILVSYDGTDFQLIGGAGGSGSGAGIVTRSTIGSYAVLPGTTTLIDTEGTDGASAANVMTSNGSISNLYLNSTANTLDGDTIYTLLKNGTPTSVTVTVPSGTNGIFSDIVDNFSVTGGDLITLQVDSTASTINTGDISFSYQVGSSGAGTPINPATTSFLFDDFIGGSVVGTDFDTPFQSIGELGWASPDTGAVITNSIPPNANHPGVIEITVAGAASKGIYLGGGGDRTFAPFGSPNTTMEFEINLQTATNPCLVGFGNTINTTSYLTYAADEYLGIATDGTVWRGVSASPLGFNLSAGSVATTTNWVKLKIVTDGTGANAEFFVDGVSLGSVAIVTYVNDRCSPWIQAYSGSVLADYFLFNRVLTR